MRGRYIGAAYQGTPVEYNDSNLNKKGIDGMVKLIASDIDGTLVPDGSDKLNPEIFDVIRKLKSQGIYFAVASGRQWKSIEKLFYPVKDEIFFIAENGAYVGARGRALFTSPMKMEQIREIIYDVREIPDCDLMLSGRDMLYTESKNQTFIDYLVLGYHNEVKQLDDLEQVEDTIIKASIYHRGYQAFEVAGKVMVPKWGDKLKVVTAGREWLDMMEPDVNKGAALREIQESLGILPEETMAFGDNLNDMELLAQAKYSYAIGNARQEIKDAANYIADTNVNDGVLKVLRTLIV